MGKKIIRFGLSARDIDKAMRELEQYKQDIIRKTDLLRERVAERLAELSRDGFAGAVVDDLLKGGQRTAQVDVSIDQRDNITLVIARGEDAVWVEFGAGYGNGMGKKDVWGFYEDGKLRLTHGAPATMPMYNAVKTVCDEIAEIAREVFQ